MRPASNGKCNRRSKSRWKNAHPGEYREAAAPTLGRGWRMAQIDENLPHREHDQWNAHDERKERRFRRPGERLVDRERGERGETQAEERRAANAHGCGV